jgi:DUF4097 and DUF4098 domain-containing protein YvlB
MSGNVTLRGTDGPSVVVTATKHGADQDRIRIEDTSSAGSVEIGVHYPKNCNCNASVDFVVDVPRSTRFAFEKISSMSGDVAVDGVTGSVTAATMSGDVHVGDVDGTVNATSMSGDVEVAITRLQGPDDLEFTSMSGNVVVRLPSDADASVSMKTTSGSISTDFPIEVHEQKYGPGAWAKGTIGGGSRALRATTMSGDVRLLRQ